MTEHLIVASRIFVLYCLEKLLPKERSVSMHEDKANIAACISGYPSCQGTARWLHRLKKTNSKRSRNNMTHNQNK